MNRRDFTRTLFGAALGAATLQQGAFRSARTKSPEGQESAVSFKLSVMLWTVFRNQPFEERLEKVVEAGYQGVELVGEFKKWSEEDFRKANRKKRALGLTFDATAGPGHGVADPPAPEGFFTHFCAMMKNCDQLQGPPPTVRSS